MLSLSCGQNQQGKHQQNRNILRRNKHMETYGLEKLGIINAAAVYRNLTPAQLTEHALRRARAPCPTPVPWW